MQRNENHPKLPEAVRDSDRGLTQLSPLLHTTKQSSCFRHQSYLWLYSKKTLKIVYNWPGKRALVCFAVSKLMNCCRERIEIVSVRCVIRGERCYDVQWGFRLFWWVTQRLAASFRLLTQQVLLAKLTNGWLPLTVHRKYKCQWIKFDSRHVKGHQLAQSFPPFFFL